MSTPEAVESATDRVQLKGPRPSLFLDPKFNSINFLRIALAVIVVESHVIALGRYRMPNGVNGTSFGQLAVYGFFGISGFLIAGSALRNHAGRYLWQRFLRIFPGFWFCLILTAFGIGIIAWLTVPPNTCGLKCYFSASDSPWNYLFHNSLLKMNQYSIAGTPVGGVAPGVWDGPLWTLIYEFCCYLLIAALALLGALSRRVYCLILTCSVWMSMVVITLFPSWDNQFSVFSHDFEMNLIRFVAVFLAGACAYLYRDQLPDSGLLATVLAIVFVGSLFLPTGGRISDFAFTDSGLLVPVVVYPVLWLGAHLPFQRVGARNDYSYGTYIFGFPATQLLILWGAAAWGVVSLSLLTLLLTGALAATSWWLVERHALRLKGLSLRMIGDSGRIRSKGLPVERQP